MDLGSEGCKCLGLVGFRVGGFKGLGGVCVNALRCVKVNSYILYILNDYI